MADVYENILYSITAMTLTAVDKGPYDLKDIQRPQMSLRRFSSKLPRLFLLVSLGYQCQQRHTLSWRILDLKSLAAL